MAEYEKGKLYDLNLNELLPDLQQPRKYMEPEALSELAASIATLGVLEPILFRLDEEQNKVVVAGARRVAAARAAGKTTIPGLFTDGNHQEVALVENMQRKGLTPIEEAEGLQALMAQHHYTQEQLATVIGKAQSTLSLILGLNRLPQEIRDDCRADRAFSRKSLIAISQRKETHRMVTAYRAQKAKLNGETPHRRRKGADDPKTVSTFLEKAVTLIRAIDSSAWDNKDKSNLQTSLTKLKGEIEQCLKRPSSR